jgi:PAS domain S-box-containing protein
MHRGRKEQAVPPGDGGARPGEPAPSRAALKYHFRTGGPGPPPCGRREAGTKHEPSDLKEHGAREGARILDHYRTIFDDLGAIVWEVDVETRRVTYVSESTERILGFQRQAWLDGTVSWEAQVHPEDREIAFGPYEQAVATDGGHANVVRFYTADGRIVWLRTGMRNGWVDGREVIRGVSLDVTVHRRNELDLQRALSMLTATLESTADGILVVNLDERVTGYNQRFAEMWRIPSELLASGDDAKMIAHVLDQLVDPKSFTERLRALYANPEESTHDTLEFLDGRVFERYTKPQLIEGRYVGRVFSFRDVTERRRAEEALRESEFRLLQSQKLEAVGRLAGGVAHDFNNILTAVLGNAGLIAAAASAPRELREQARDIELAASRAALLTRQLLAFSRRQRFDMHVVDLNQVVADMDKLLRVTLGERIELSVRPSPHACPVRIDRGQIEQVILNLVLNGRDAMPGGGRLEITIAGPSEAEAAKAGRPEDAFVRLEVRDNGQGMDEATREHIFEPFFTTKAFGAGTGLGLATVYGIVQQSRGTIDVETAPAAGTKFRIQLPRANAQVESTGFVPSLPPVRGHETVLVVEDDRQVRGLLCESLRAAGHVVLEARDGDDAIRIANLHAGEIHMLVTDVVMPGITGIELSARLLQKRPGLRVLFISGFAEDADSSNVLEGSSFLQKPFTMETLVRRVREVLAPR